MDPLSIDTSITSVNAQILTQNSLKENQEILLETIGRLQERRDYNLRCSPWQRK